MSKKTNMFAFIQQVRSEVSKVTWPNRRETLVTTFMVLVMVFLSAVFFFLVDQLIGWGLGFLLSVG